MRRKLYQVLIILASLLAYAGPVHAQMLSGSYTGDGAGNRAITGLGFQPDVVIIKGDTAQVAVMRTSTMTGDSTKSFGGTALGANLIQSLDPSGFTIGTDSRVNGSGISYYWIAFKAVAGEVVVGSYTGDQADNRSITGVGFQPGYVIVMGATAQPLLQRSSAMIGDLSFRFDASSALTNRIQAFEADGFQVGTDASVNQNGTAYHYVAWKAVAGKMNVGSYTGNSTDNRNITGVGFQPEYVIIQVHFVIRAVHRPGSVGAADSTLNFTGAANFSDGIQALQSDGFQVGTSTAVNRNNTAHYWMAFALQQCGAVTESSYVAATAQSGQAIVYWSTSNPALILRKTAPFAGEAPANGTTYTVGQTIGTATVAYNGSVAETSFTQTGLTDGTTYYYKVFARCGTTYAAGVGAEVNARPVAASTGTAWSYMLAGGSILKAGIAGEGTIHTSSNASWTVSLSTANGTQSWAPVSTTSAIQGWLVWIPISGGSTKAVIGGDQGGKVYSVDVATGGTNWSPAMSGADAVQAPVAAQLRAFSDASFQSTYTTDVIFAASRNASTTNNKLYALRASDGVVLWTFNGSGTSNVDYIVGMPYVDYSRNRLYVASRAGASGTQSSLWVLNTLDGTLVQSFNLGHLESSPTLSYDGATLYVGNTAGDLYAINAPTLALKWISPSALGTAIKGFVWEDFTTAGRLYFSTADGNVWCLQDPGAGSPPNPATPVWKTPVAGPSTPVLLGALYVGSSDGKVHQINLTTGLDEKQYTVGDGAATVGDASTEDGNQIFVATTAGKIYKLPLPLP